MGRVCGRCVKRLATVSVSNFRLELLGEILE